MKSAFDRHVIRTCPPCSRNLVATAAAVAHSPTSPLPARRRTQPVQTLDRFHQAAAKAQFEEYFAVRARGRLHRHRRQRALDGCAVQGLRQAAFRQRDVAGRTPSRTQHHRRRGWQTRLRLTSCWTTPALGRCRGTGVLRLIDGQWRIEQYHLTIPVPNELASEVVKRIREASQDGAVQGEKCDEHPNCQAGQRSQRRRRLRIGTVRRPPRGCRKTEFAKQNWYDVWYPNLAQRGTMNSGRRRPRPHNGRRSRRSTTAPKWTPPRTCTAPAWLRIAGDLFGRLLLRETSRTAIDRSCDCCSPSMATRNFGTGVVDVLSRGQWRKTLQCRKTTNQVNAPMRSF